MQKTININPQKLADQFTKIGEIAKDKKWSFLYDGELDSLYYSPKEMKPDYILHSLGKEISVFVDKDSNLGGLFIEYYKANLTSHEDEFKDFSDIFTQKSDHMTTIPDRDKTKAAALSAVLKAELLSEIFPQLQSGAKIQAFPA